LEKRTEHSDLLQLLLFLFGALKQEATGRQETLLRAVTSLIQEIPDATLTTLNEIFEPHDRKKQTLAKFQTNIAKLDPMDQEFFRVDFDGSEFGQSRAQIRARIQSLVTDAIFRTMFNATTQKLSMAAEMDAGKVIVINAYEDLLKNGTEVFGRFFIALAAQAAQARARMPEEKRMPTYFYIDECYTHYDVLTNLANREAIQDANANGFRINLSANSIDHADQLADLRIAPVTVILPPATTANTTTPKGRTVVVCPINTTEGVTCATCQLCSRMRSTIIGFPATGGMKATVKGTHHDTGN
jgi:hypothetical protein